MEHGTCLHLHVQFFVNQFELQVYWENAAQIISPHDVNISKHILENLELDDASWNISGVLSHPLRKDPTVEIDRAYYEELSSYVHYKYDSLTTQLFCHQFYLHL